MNQDSTPQAQGAPGPDAGDPVIDGQGPASPPLAPRPGCLVVGVGASAGGLPALENLFSHLPEGGGAAFVVVTHQHLGQTNLLPELLGKRTPLPVAEARDGTRVEPGRVYLCPPGEQLIIEGGVLRVVEPPPGRLRLPIDRFFRSLAADQGPRAVGIVLSGTGTDGTEGVRAIKGEGGLTMAQDQRSAQHGGMPQSAMDTGQVDLVLPPDQMPRRLQLYADGLHGARLGDEEPLAGGYQELFLRLRQRTGHDLSLYRTGTVRRRLERRLRLLDLRGLPEYLAYVRSIPTELDQLLQESLIGVTSFFRDPDAFEALARTALPELLQDKPPGSSLRVWVPACSTGEEAYSLAMLLEESLERMGLHLSLQMFATDASQRAIDIARAGRYPAGIAADVSAERLQRFFREEQGTFRIVKNVRDSLMFATQDVLKDPPFTRVDLISCRNLLIYLQPQVQRRLLGVFHYALRHEGVLLLGSSEISAGFEELFTPLDRKWKIFRRAGEALAPRLPFIPGQSEGPRPGRDARGMGRQGGLVAAADRLLLDLFCPDSVLVNSAGEIVYVRGRTGAYLEPAEGQASLHVLGMAREGLGPDLALALRRASAEGIAVVRRGVQVKTNGARVLVDLTVQPVSARGLSGLFLITFATAGEPMAALSATSPDDDQSDLRQELRRTRESLQASAEDLEASNEELQCTNEELQSTNEELQSTNEELETSKEELQSLNEELQAVNAELQEKILELSQAHDDMANLLNSTDIATVFLDRSLHIKRFTPQARRLFKLIPSDLGRPLADLTSRLEYAEMIPDARGVLATLVPRELEVRSEDGAWYLARILPYRRADDELDGLVLTFVDVTELRLAYGVVETLVESCWEPLAILDDQSLRVQAANQAFCAAHGLSRAELVGRALDALPGEAGSATGLAARLHALASSGEPLRDLPLELPRPGGGTAAWRLNATRLEPLRDAARRILLALRPAGEGGPRARSDA